MAMGVSNPSSCPFSLLGVPVMSPGSTALSSALVSSILPRKASRFDSGISALLSSLVLRRWNEGGEGVRTCALEGAVV